MKHVSTCLALLWALQGVAPPPAQARTPHLQCGCPKEVTCHLPATSPMDECWPSPCSPRWCDPLPDHGCTHCNGPDT